MTEVTVRFTNPRAVRRVDRESDEYMLAVKIAKHSGSSVMAVLKDNARRKAKNVLKEAGFSLVAGR